MSRWLYVGATLVGAVLLGALVGSPAIHSPGDADCSNLEDGEDEPILEGPPIDSSDPHEAGDCPIDDAAEMAGQSASDS